MRLTLGDPDPALAGVVAGYADFAEVTGAPRATREAPGGGIVVIVDLDQGWTVEGERFGSFAGGLYARPVGVRHEGSSAGVQFSLEPPAVRALFGMPAAELTERTVALDAVMGRTAFELAERLHAAPDAQARFAVLDRVLLETARRAEAPRQPDVERAWGLLRATGGRIRIGALADALGCSRRHLAARFATEVGVPPKVAARLIRFETARRRLGTVPLARPAADHGYADQAHLAREFRELGGAAPTEFPNLQAGGGAAA